MLQEPSNPEGIGRPANRGTGLVQVENGVCFGPWAVAGRTILYVRANLATAYNIHPDAMAVLNGEIANDDRVLQVGDVLAFHHLAGYKGFERCWTKQEFMKEVGLTEAGWQQWCKEGLPYEETADGKIFLFDITVDPWLMRRQAYRDYVTEYFKGSPPKWFKRGQWYHLPFEDRPEDYKRGSILGRKLAIAQSLRPTTNKRDGRELERAARTGVVWVRRYGGDSFEVSFREESHFVFAESNLKKLRGQG
jgi:hypothetical protein